MQQYKLISIYILIALIIYYISYLNTIQKINHINNILEYSLMINLLNDEVSKDRLQNIQNIYGKLGLTINIEKSLHWRDDEEELKTLPLIKKGIIPTNAYKERPGAYGLAGSFYKCIKKAKEYDYPHLIFFEDDAIPLIKNKYKFYDEFINIINTIPNSGDGIYFLSVMVPECAISSKGPRKKYAERFKNLKEEGWKQSKLLDDTWGTHSIYFTKKGIDNVYNHLQRKKMDMPIDHWLRYNFKCWHYTNNINDDGFFMGLFEQYNTFCESRINTLDN
tara:strand:+ start:1161 stop:1991 length:831 start_codon:yes stop_codon:yes gene_type:complete